MNSKSKEKTFNNKKKTHPIAFQIVIIVVSLTIIINLLHGLCLILDFNQISFFQEFINIQVKEICKGNIYEGYYSFLASIFALFLLIGFIKLKKWAWSSFMIWGGVNLIQLLVQWYFGNPNYLGMLTNSIVVYILNLKIIKELYEI